ncbi:MAG: transposase [Candidatus Sumerlaeaceae bacterium]|nr:transposase [Candidatus Sumerlaeaceae bacterium]
MLGSPNRIVRFMARLARVAVAQTPYHITHRGNRRARIFLCDTDREAYLALLERYCRAHGLHIWAWCLMSNHIHLIAWPEHKNSIARALGNAQGKYAQWFNHQHGFSGHVWANRFFSTPLDEEHLWTAVRYVELNPVRAGMVAAAETYVWSSAAKHCGLTQAPNAGYGGLDWCDCPFPGQVTAAGWVSWLHSGLTAELVERIRRRTMTGRPCGSASFVERLEDELNRILQPQKSGRKPKQLENGDLTDDMFSNK